MQQRDVFILPPPPPLELNETRERNEISSLFTAADAAITLSLPTLFHGSD